MFSWFLGGDPDEPKRSDPFAISWYKKEGQLFAGSGLEISATGLVFTTKTPPPEKEFNVRLVLRDKTIDARVCSKRPQLISTAAGLAHKFTCKFIGIAADHWDLIVRYVNGTAEVGGPEGSFYDPEKPDDEFRTLPSLVQDKIIENLISSARLEPPAGATAPLIRLTASGEQRTKDGRNIKKFTIHSRVFVEGEDTPQDYDTTFAVDEAGNVARQ